MGLSVVFVSGVRRSGKSAVIHTLVDRICPKPPHYLRLLKKGKESSEAGGNDAFSTATGLASARRLDYDAERVFEILPEALTAIHRADRFGAVLIEADADPVLRHAYPYDHRVFVMPVPETVNTVFRDPTRAAHEFRRVLDDTTAFASEIFGLFSGEEGDTEPHEERSALSDTQMRGFLYSPLGDELATRIQLQPAYHGLIESDVVIVNTSCGKTGSETANCLRRLARLLERLGGTGARRGEMFLCNPCDADDKMCRKMLKALKPMCAGGK